MKPTLSVYPNPWAALDAEGVPCGLCPRDPEKDAGGPLAFVGARLDPDRTKVLEKLRRGDDRSARQTTAYRYMGVASNDPELASKLGALEPIELPDTRYYRARLADGALIPADAQTALVSSARLGVRANLPELGKPENSAPAAEPKTKRRSRSELDAEELKP